MVLFVLGPAVLAANIRAWGTWLIIPSIWLLASICLALLLVDPAFRRRRLWNVAGIRRAWKPMLGWFIAGAIGLACLLAVYQPRRLFEFPLRRPEIWAVVMIGYPIASVYAQEIAFRAFFFHRYRALFGHGSAGRVRVVLASALAFGFAHIVMHNPWAIAFSTIGGILFAYTYLRSRSLLAVWIEHAAYGCFLFTIGWGQFFFGGSIA